MLKILEAIKYVKPTIAELSAAEISELQAQAENQANDIIISKRAEVIGYIDDKIVEKNEESFSDKLEVLPATSVMFYAGETVPAGYQKLDIENLRTYESDNHLTDSSYKNNLIPFGEPGHDFKLEQDGFQLLGEYINDTDFSIGTTIIIKNKVYKIGGYINSTNTTTNIVAYCNINTDGSITNDWIKSISLPVNLGNFQYFLSDKYLYIIGGYTTASVNSVYYTEITEDGLLTGWIKDTNLPVVLSNSNSLTIGNKFYLFGGYTTAYVATVYMADVTIDGKLTGWRTTASLPAVMRLAHVFYTGKYIYYVGGYTNASVNTVYRTSLNTDGTLGTWSIVTTTEGTLPFALSLGNHFVLDNYCYIITGWKNTSTTINNAILRAEIKPDKTLGAFQEYLTFPNHIRSGYQNICITKNFLYCFGGFSATGDYTSKKIYKFSLPGGANDYSSDICKEVRGSSYNQAEYINGQPWRLQHDINKENNSILSWNTATNLPSTTFVFTSAIVTKNRVYLLGGDSTISSNATNANVYYAPINLDGTLGNWVKDTNLITAKSRAMVIQTKNRVYLIGGTGTGSPVKTILTASIDENGVIGSWDYASDLPGALSFTQAVITKNVVYLCGGNNGAVTNIVYYAPINKDGTISNWNTGPSLPAAIAYHQTVIIKNKIYVIGGYNGSSKTSIYSATFGIDGLIDNWVTETNSLPIGFSNSSSFVTNDKIYLCGGYTTASVNTVLMASIDTDGNIGTWEYAPALPEVFSRAQLFTTNNYLYILGGATSAPVATIYYSAFSGGKNDYSNDTYLGETVVESKTIEASNGSPINQQNEIVRPEPVDTFYESNTNTNIFNDNSCIAYYPLDTNINDITGTYNGTATNITYNDGKFGKAALFNGTTSVISNNYIIGATKNLSISFWFKCVGDPRGRILSDKNNNWLMFGIDTASADKLIIRAFGTLTTLQSVTILTDTWYHVVINMSSQFTVFLNGVQIYTVAMGTATAPSGLIFGRDDYYKNDYYSGYLDQMRIFNRPLTEAEITTLYTGENTAGVQREITFLPTFTEQPQTLAAATSLSGSFTYGNRVYLIGGYVGTASISTTQSALINADGTLGTWELNTPLPEINRGFQTLVIKNRVYLFGGFISATTNKIYYSELNETGVLNWVLDTNVLPISVETHMMFNSEKYVYLIGGYNGSSALSTIYRATINLDGSLAAFTLYNSTLPAGYRYSNLVKVKNRVYLIGGYTTADSNIIYSAYINNDGDLSTWQTESPLPEVYRSYNSILATDKHIYLIGGYNKNKTIIIDINNDGSISNYRYGNPLPYLGGYSSVIATSKYLYILGGAIGTTAGTNKIWRSDLPEIDNTIMEPFLNTYTLTEKVKPVFSTPPSIINVNKDQRSDLNLSFIDPNITRTLDYSNGKYMPQGLVAFRTLVLGNKLYIFGGRTEATNTIKSDNIWVCDIVDGVFQYNWKLAGKLKAALSDFNLALIGDRVYIIGGWLNGATRTTTTVSKDVYYFKVKKGTDNKNYVDCSERFDHLVLAEGISDGTSFIIDNNLYINGGYKSTTPTTYMVGGTYRFSFDKNYNLTFGSETSNFSVSYINDQTFKFNNYVFVARLTGSTSSQVLIPYTKSGANMSGVHKGFYIDSTSTSLYNFSKFSHLLKIGNYFYQISGYNGSAYTNKIQGVKLETLNNTDAYTKDVNITSGYYGQGQIVITESRIYLLGGRLNSTTTLTVFSDDIYEYIIPEAMRSNIGSSTDPLLLTFEGNQLVNSVKYDINQLIQYKDILVNKDDYSPLNTIIKTSPEKDTIEKLLGI